MSVLSECTEQLGEKHLDETTLEKNSFSATWHFPFWPLQTLKAGHGGGVIIICTADVALSVGSNKISKGHRLPEKNYNRNGNTFPFLL